MIWWQATLLIPGGTFGCHRRKYRTVVEITKRIQENVNKSEIYKKIYTENIYLKNISMILTLNEYHHE